MSLRRIELERDCAKGVYEVEVKEGAQKLSFTENACSEIRIHIDVGSIIKKIVCTRDALVIMPPEFFEISVDP